MSITEQIARIQTDRNTMRTKLVNLGLVQSTADLDDIATAVDSIDNRGAVSATVQEGDTYTIPKGYHNGSGTVSGVKGGGNYSLQSKTIAPTKSQQNITPDSGYYGLSDVTINAIPENYQDVTSVTAGAADVLANKIIVDKTGKQVAGSMPNNGAVNKILDLSTAGYTVPEGYHNGSGSVTIAPESKTATPTKATQSIIPSSGKVLSQVTVAPIPNEYQDISGVTATADKVLEDSTFIDAEGEEVTGTMPNNGGLSATIMLKSSTAKIPQGYHDGSGTISIDESEQNKIISANIKSGVTILGVSGKSTVVDTANTTASADKILSGETAYVNGGKVTGTMTNNGAVSKTLDATSNNQSYTVPKGYHDGKGAVSITLEEKSATPTKSTQTITPTSGKVLSKVTVAAIPSSYITTTDATATAADILVDKSAYIKGSKVTGSMPNNGAYSNTLDGLTVTSVTIPSGYHSGLGTISLTNDIETALAAI